jgi:hypothetical protein
MVKRIFTGKQMRSSNPRKSAAMGELIKNPKISKVLNEEREQREFYSALSKRRSGELYARDKTLSHKEVEEIGRAMKDTLGKKRIKISSEQIENDRPHSWRDRQESASEPSTEPAKNNIGTKSGIENRFSLKDSKELEKLPATESSQNIQTNNASLSSSQNKERNERASHLLDDILNKK